MRLCDIWDPDTDPLVSQHGSSPRRAVRAALPIVGRMSRVPAPVPGHHHRRLSGRRSHSRCRRLLVIVLASYPPSSLAPPLGAPFIIFFASLSSSHRIPLVRPRPYGLDPPQRTTSGPSWGSELRTPRVVWCRPDRRSKLLYSGYRVTPIAWSLDAAWGQPFPCSHLFV